MTAKRSRPTLYPEGEKFQGREITATIQAPNEAALEDMLTDLSDYTNEMGLEPVQVLSKGPDPDGGYRAVVQAHNKNVISWAKERWEGRGGGLEARIKKEQEEREKRLKELKLTLEAAKVRTLQESEQATIEAERAKSEQEYAKHLTERRQSAQKRREAARERRKAALALRLETFEEGVRRVGGFAGAQAATFQTALYTPGLFAEEATAPIRPKRPTRPLMQDIFDARLP